MFYPFAKDSHSDADGALKPDSYEVAQDLLRVVKT